MGDFTRGRNPYGNPDSNQAPLVKLARRIGATVRIATALGKGFPDLVVGFRGSTRLWECKKPGGELRDDQADFHRDWRGAPVEIVRTADDVIRLLTGTPAPRLELGAPRLIAVTLRYSDGRQVTHDVPDDTPKRAVSAGPLLEPTAPEPQARGLW